MKISKLFIIFLSFSILMLINNCSETTQPNLHPVDWMDTSSDNFHGHPMLIEGLEGIEYCRK